MCGIIAIQRLDKRNPMRELMRLYDKQKHRGTEGFGFVALLGGKMLHYARTETEDAIKVELEKINGDEIMFHHRFPTSTPNFAEAAHPIKVSNKSLKYDYYLVHNGIVYEIEAKKKEHEEAGFVYTTEIIKEIKTKKRKMVVASKWNDSETLAIELARDLDKEGNGIDLQGSISFVMYQIDKRSRRVIKKFWGTNGGMPLKFLELEGLYRIISSEGSGADVPENKLFELDYEAHTISCRAYNIGKTWRSKIGFWAGVKEEEPFIFEKDNPDYVSLQEEYDQLKLAYDKAIASGEDETEICDALDDVEAQLAAIEAEITKSELSKTLIG